MINITLDITKTTASATQYDLVLVISSATGIDKNLFVLDFPGLVFQQIATPFAIDNYPVYDTSNPPAIGTDYVRIDTVTLSFTDPDDAADALDSVKTQLEQLGTDWDVKTTSFTGTEQYVVTAP